MSLTYVPNADLWEVVEGRAEGEILKVWFIGRSSVAIVLQRNWKFCTKCNGLFFNGGGVTGVCPAGEGHDPTGSGDYALMAESDPNETFGVT
jgi:hypothetical protein